MKKLFLVMLAFLLPLCLITCVLAGCITRSGTPQSDAKAQYESALASARQNSADVQIKVDKARALLISCPDTTDRSVLEALTALLDNIVFPVFENVLIDKDEAAYFSAAQYLLAFDEQWKYQLCFQIESGMAAVAEEMNKKDAADSISKPPQSLVPETSSAVSKPSQSFAPAASSAASKPPQSSTPTGTTLPGSASLKKGMTAAEYAQAYAVAERIVQPYLKLPRIEQLDGIMSTIYDIYRSGTYSMTDPHYSDVYGALILKRASCAGVTRAVGLCLTILGIPYEHVNENKYTHQWCRVECDGMYMVVDGQGGVWGDEPEPYKHPLIFTPD
jgi:hypothetical protein